MHLASSSLYFLVSGSQNLLTQRDIPICDFEHKSRIGVVEHHVEVLYSLNAFQGLPILKPDNL